MPDCCHPRSAISRDGLPRPHYNEGLAEVTPMKRLLSIFPAALVLIFLTTGSHVAADQIPQGWKAHNMQPVGYSDMEGRPPFKLAIKQVGGKWYLYTGHLWHDGWSIVDVTDPANPK